MLPIEMSDHVASSSHLEGNGNHLNDVINVLKHDMQPLMRESEERYTGSLMGQLAYCLEHHILQDVLAERDSYEIGAYTLLDISQFEFSW